MLRKPRIEAMLMMAPPRPSAARCLATSLATRKAPLRLVSSTRSQSSSVCSSAFLPATTPELLTRMVTGPSSVSAALTAAATLAGTVTSHSTGSARPPSPSISAATAASRSSRRAASATLAPLAAISVAKCAPNPLDAPVTSATSPVKSTFMLMAAPRSQRASLVAQYEFLDLAGRGLGQGAEDDRLRRLEMGEIGAAPSDHLVLAQRRTGFRGDERAGTLAPFGIGPRHHCGLHDRRMAVEHLLDLERRDILAARDDDVLGAVLDLDIAVGMHDAEIAGVKPAAGKGFRRSRRVLQISFHHRVAAQDELAERRAVRWHVSHRRRVDDAHALERRVAHALPRHEAGPLVERQSGPVFLPGAQRRRPVAFGKAVEMGDAEAHALHSGDHRGGRRRAAGRHLGNVPKAPLRLLRRVDQHG